MDLLSRLVTVEYPKIHREVYMKNLEKPSIKDKPALVI